MNDLNSRRVIAHIDEAQNWLDKAKDEYTESNPLQGDLHLNLAQAEVRYAWELSYRGSVLKRKGRDSKPETSGVKRWNYYLVPVAAVLLVAVLGGVFGLYRMSKAGPEGILEQVANGQSGERDMFPSDRSEGMVAEKTAAAGKSMVSVEGKQKKLAPAPHQAELDLLPTLADASDESLDLLGSLPKTNDGNVPVKSHPNGGGKMAVSSIILENESRARRNPVRNQPVSAAGLIFDEEALTREATRSLRLGK